MNRLQPNRHCVLARYTLPEKRWVTENTAILIVHGMGFQLPFETLEQFGKTLVHTYQEMFPEETFTISHALVRKKEGSESWFDNVLRIRMSGADAHIDLYEYYWAHHTENRADLSDISDWISGVCKTAKKFYRRNKSLRDSVEQPSILFDSPVRYFNFLNVVAHLTLLWQLGFEALKNATTFIPLFGRLFSGLVSGFERGATKVATNFLSDLAAYMVTDAKSKYYPVRRAILDGAVDALCYLLEAGTECGSERAFTGSRTYPAVIVAGHSLGSQIGYDAINRVNQMINNCRLKTYNGKGECRLFQGRTIAQQLRGFVTFGSPLDKTAFFLRDQIPDDQFVRRQLLDHYLCFKQRDWSPSIGLEAGFFPVLNDATPERLLEKIKWFNYYDRHDYVSGALDYYQHLTNVDCRFEKGLFTHTSYWSCREFHRDLICNVLSYEPENSSSLRM